MWDFKLFSKASSLKPTEKEMCENKDRRPSTTHTSAFFCTFDQIQFPFFAS